MRTTLALDDDRLAEAQRLTGVTEKTALVWEALRALVERESARQLTPGTRLWSRDRRLAAGAARLGLQHQP
jgi:Arc/MetJ family transcription regulator